MAGGGDFGGATVAPRSASTGTTGSTGTSHPMSGMPGAAVDQLHSFLGSQPTQAAPQQAAPQPSGNGGVFGSATPTPIGAQPNQGGYANGIPSGSSSGYNSGVVGPMGPFGGGFGGMGGGSGYQFGVPPTSATQNPSQTSMAPPGMAQAPVAQYQPPQVFGGQSFVAPANSFADGYQQMNPVTTYGGKSGAGMRSMMGGNQYSKGGIVSLKAKK